MALPGDSELHGTLVAPDMSLSVTLESFDSLVASRQDLHRRLRWDSVFVLPCWLAIWWQEFGAGTELYLCAVRQEGTVIGVAPLLVEGEKASFIGSADVCDYLDFVVAPRGGYITSSSNSTHPGCRRENYVAVVRAVRKYGVYS